MEWLIQYHRDGYAVLEGVLPSDLIDSHLDAFGALTQQHMALRAGADEKPRVLSPDEQERLLREQAALYYEHEPTLGLILHARLREILNAAFNGEGALIGYPKTVIRGGGVDTHRDPSSFVLEPGGNFCRFWIALEDLEPESGLVYVYPGTFLPPDFYDRLLDERPDLLQILQDLARDGCGTMNQFMSRMAAFQRPIMEKFRAEAETRERVTFQLKKGDVLLFKPSLLHGSLKADPNLTRKSLILDCQGESVRRYLPHAYYGSRHDFRRPENLVPEFVVETGLGKFVCADWRAIAERISTPVVMN